jgi:hypothetical protein
VSTTGTNAGIVTPDEGPLKCSDCGGFMTRAWRNPLGCGITERIFCAWCEDPRTVALKEKLRVAEDWRLWGVTQ